MINSGALRRMLCTVHCALYAVLMVSASPETINGADRQEMLRPHIQGRRIALVINHTSVLSNPQHTHLLDTLLAQGYDIRRIFTPEHGLQGTAAAGQHIPHTRHATGIPVTSLYGAQKQPGAQQLSDIDVLIYDIQDVGARFYTYISTLHYIMQACAEAHKPLIILDRPNPNDTIDGPILQPELRSFIGMHPIPILYGLTPAELARMLNGERWLSTPDTCPLIIIPLLHWRHGDSYTPPVPPSPNLPNANAIHHYPSLCLFEGTAFSVGRGTPLPFQLLAHPALPDTLFFTSQPDAKPYFTLRYLFQAQQALAPTRQPLITRPEHFDCLVGSSDLRHALESGLPLNEDSLRATWQADLFRYRLRRLPYLLYFSK